MALYIAALPAIVPINARSSRFVTTAELPFRIRTVNSRDDSKVDTPPRRG
jgi:hypothetical protein